MGVNMNPGAIETTVLFAGAAIAICTVAAIFGYYFLAPSLWAESIGRVIAQQVDEALPDDDEPPR